MITKTLICPADAITIGGTKYLTKDQHYIGVQPKHLLGTDLYFVTNNQNKQLLVKTSNCIYTSKIWRLL